jgi:perosamine synthetase
MICYPVAKPYIDQVDIDGVVAVMKSGNLSLGPVHKRFEEKFAEYIGTQYACSVSSGTAGLHLAMLVAGIGPGDEVITSPFSFIASANCMLYVGAKPVFVDVDPVSYNLDPKKIEEKITSNTKAILVVHIFGQAADMDSILAIANKYNLKIIEDACEAIGASYKGRRVGTFGESAVFAFYPNKQMTTGEGGMLVTNDQNIYSLCKSLSNQGRAEDMQWLDHERLGYNYRLDEMSASLGLTQLAKIDYLLQERRKIAAWYDEVLKPYEAIVQTPRTAPENLHSFFVYVVTLNTNEASRDQIILDLKDEGIQTKPYLPSIHLFSFYKDRFGYQEGDYPISEKISSTSLSLPIYIGLNQSDIEKISSTLNQVLMKYA